MATYYVSSSGNDTTGDGSSGTPWLTINKAINTAASGDTIILKTSATAYPITGKTGVVTFTKDLTIKGESTPVYTPGVGWSGAIVDGLSTATTWIERTMTYQNLIWTNITNFGTTNAFFDHTTATFLRCIFKNFTVTNQSTDRAGGLASPRTSGALSFTSCAFSSIAGSLFPGSSRTSLTVNLSNNVFYACNRIISEYFGCTGTVTSKNNIFYASTSQVWMQAYSSTLTNVFSNNCTVNYTSVPTGSNNITSDPLFVDAANGNFRLRPSSPCVNTGVAL